MHNIFGYVCDFLASIFLKKALKMTFIPENIASISSSFFIFLVQGFNSCRMADPNPCLFSKILLRMRFTVLSALFYNFLKRLCLTRARTHTHTSAGCDE